MLSTCKTIRTEAIRIFYEENKFHLCMTNFNSDTCVNWQNTSAQLEVSHAMIRDIGAFSVTARITPVTGSGRSWTNYLEHMRHLHAGTLESTPTPREDLNNPSAPRNVPYAGSLLFCNMIQLARTLRKEPWGVVERLILDQKAVIVALGYNCDE